MLLWSLVVCRSLMTLRAGREHINSTWKGATIVCILWKAKNFFSRQLRLTLFGARGVLCKSGSLFFSFNHPLDNTASYSKLVLEESGKYLPEPKLKLLVVRIFWDFSFKVCDLLSVGPFVNGPHSFPLPCTFKIMRR